MINLILISVLGISNASISFKADVKPIIEKRCTPCHTGGIPTLPDFTSYDTAKGHKHHLKLKVWVQKSMPPGNSTGMTNEERKLIKDWIDGGTEK